MSADDEPSGRVGAMANHLTDALAGAHEKVRHKVNADKLAHLTHVLETIEQEYAPVLAPFVTHLLDDPNTPPEVRDLLAPLIEPTNLGQSLILGIALGSILSPVLATATAPFVQQLANAVWVSHPDVPLSAPELAVAVLKGVTDEDTAAGLAAIVGTNRANFHTMVQNVGQTIGMQEALLLLRRGQIDEPEFERIVRYSNVRFDFLPDILKLKYAPLSVGEAVTAALKGHLDDATAAEYVGFAGIDPAHFPLLKATAGRPPGIEQMLHLRNRNLATTQDVTDAVRQSDVNDHYLPFVLHLGEYVPPVRSIMAMLRAGAIDDAKATTLFEHNGVLASDIPGYLAEAHHGRTAAVKELSQATVIRMYANGLLTHAEASARLVALGYHPGDTTLLLAFADDVKVERYANAIITRLHTLYVSHKADDTDVHSALSADGIDTATITELLTLWKIERTANVHAPTAANVLHAFRLQVINPLETRTRLTQLGVQVDDLPIVVASGFPPTMNRNDLSAIIHAVLVGDTAFPGEGGTGGSGKSLTQYQIVQLYKNKTITRAVAKQDLINIGFDAATAEQLLVLADTP